MLFAAIESKVTDLDIIVTIVYMVAIVSAGCWVGIRHRRKTRSGDAKEYFLAGGTLKWPMIGMALFATNISCVHLVSLAQAGYEQGLLMGNFEWMAAFTLILLALFFAPFYIRSKVSTLPDFLEKRYGRACRDILAGFSLVSAVIVHIGFSLLTGAIVLSGLFGVDPWVAIVVIAVATALYVVVGGLMAVVFTETVETVVLLVGAFLITWFSFRFLGGEGGFWAGWGQLVNALDQPGEGAMLSMLRSGDDPSGLPWYAIMLGYPVLGIWYWCADQTIVQRVLGAQDENHARVGPLFAALIKILPVFLFVLPGLMFYAMVNQGMFADLQGAMNVETGKATLASLGSNGQWEVMKTSEAYTEMIVRLLPSGLTGVMAAALIAALMSTVSGALNSISTLVSYDLWKRFKPQTSEEKLVLIGRISAVGAMLVAMGLVPLLGKYGSIFEGLNTIIAHIAPPVTAVFLWGVIWKKASYAGALTTMIAGAILGIAVFTVNTLNPTGWLATLPGGFMMMAFYLFLACSLILLATSLIKPKSAGEDPENFDYGWTRDYPELNRAFPLEAYQEAAQGCEVAGSIFMEVDVDPGQHLREAEFFSDLARHPENHIAGVVAKALPESDDFSAELECLARLKVKGIRRVLHTQPDALSRSERFRDNLNRLAGLDWSFDLCVLQRQLGVGLELVRACPGVRFMLDHAGVPEIAGNDAPHGEGFKDWQAGIRALAAEPNLQVKLSGIPLYAAAAQRNADGLLPYLDTLLEAFGSGRIVWGGDWPVCTLAVPVAAWVDLTRQLLDRAGLPEAEQSAILSGNAEAFYRIAP